MLPSGSSGVAARVETQPLVSAVFELKRGDSKARLIIILASAGVCLALCIGITYSIVVAHDASQEFNAHQQHVSARVPLPLSASQGCMAHQRHVSSHVPLPNCARLILMSTGEGMGTFPITLAQYRFLTTSSGRIGVMPCAKDGRMVPCTKNVSDPLPLSEYFDMASLGLDAFSPAKGDLHPEVVFCMTVESSDKCESHPWGPRNLSAWKRAMVNCATNAGIFKLRKEYIKGFHVSPIYFNFSHAREAEIAVILGKNKLAPALPGDWNTGNYVVYHWRAEKIQGINYSFCAQRLVQHAHAHARHSRKIIVSNMPFNTSTLPRLWVTNESVDMAEDPDFLAARRILIDAGFTKVELMAPDAGYDLIHRDIGHVSIWDTIIARGGSTLSVCTDPSCEPCSRRSSKFAQQLIKHYRMYHGETSVVHTSWMGHLEDDVLEYNG